MDGKINRYIDVHRYTQVYIHFIDRYTYIYMERGDMHTLFTFVSSP